MTFRTLCKGLLVVCVAWFVLLLYLAVGLLAKDAFDHCLLCGVSVLAAVVAGHCIVYLGIESTIEQQKIFERSERERHDKWLDQIRRGSKKPTPPPPPPKK